MGVVYSLNRGDHRRHDGERVKTIRVSTEHAGQTVIRVYTKITQELWGHYATLHLGLCCFEHFELCSFCVMLAPQRVAWNYFSRVFWFSVCCSHCVFLIRWFIFFFFFLPLPWIHNPPRRRVICLPIFWFSVSNCLHTDHGSADQINNRTDWICDASVIRIQS